MTFLPVPYSPLAHDAEYSKKRVFYLACEKKYGKC